MAPKRPSPLDEPPSASPSYSEEEEAVETSSEAASSSEDDEEDQPPKPTDKKPSSKKPPPPSPSPIPKSQSKPSVSVSVSESETETESDSDDEIKRPNQNTDVTASKPVASKETSKPKKSKSQPPLKSTAKRPSENSRPVTDSKKAKKEKGGGKTDGVIVAEEGGKKAGDEARKLFQRIWSEDDEMVVLNGLVEYAEKTGESPLKDMNGFHNFIKRSVHADVSKDQLVTKIRNLKRKYLTNIERMRKGKEPRFSKPCDKNAFELSMKIWPEEVANGVTDQSNGKKNKVQSVGASQKSEADLGSGLKEARKVDTDDGEAGSLSSLSGMIRFHKSLGLSGLDNDTISRGYGLIGATKKEELEERWKKLHIAELELLVERAELVVEQANLILEATKSSGN